MQTIQNILIAVDLHQGDRLADEALSATSAAVVEQGLELAGATRAAVTFCAVLEISEQALELIQADKENIFVTVEDVAKKALDRLVARAKSQGTTATAVVRTGSSSSQLLQQVTDGKHDLIMVGTRKRSGMARAIFGSTAQRLLRTAPCPVWIVKPEETREIREVVVATDMTDACTAALHSGVYVARLLKAKLFVVHALEFPFETYLHTAGVMPAEISMHRTRLREQAQRKLDAQLQAADARTLPFGVKTDILEGAPDEVLPEYIRTNQVDLLIIGSHGHTGLSRLLLGNTAERLLPSVNASVLTIHTP